MMRDKFKAFILKNGAAIREIVSIELIIIFVFSVVIANCYIPTESMEPTIKASSRVLASRLSYKTNPPDRNDVVVFYYPDNPRYIFCKRIIGLPGETLEIKDGTTYINGDVLVEDYVKNEFTGSYGPFYIPKKGDVATLIDDNVFIGLYKVGDKNFLEKYCENSNGQYIVSKDCYFCMGDNRDNSEDARFWNNKYVTTDDIIGRLFINLSNGFKSID